MSDEISDDSSKNESKYNIVKEDDYLGDIDESILNEKKKLEELKKNVKIKSLLRKRKRKLKAKDIDNRKNSNNSHNSNSSDLAESNNYYENEEDKDEEKEKEDSIKKEEDNFNQNEFISQYVKKPYISEPKIDIKNELKNIMKNEVLDIYQKEELNKLILEIKNKNIKDLVKKDKLEIVFNLDKTCIFGFIINPKNLKELKERNPQIDLKSFSFLYQNKSIICGLIIRKGLLNFLEFANTFCNFYISSLGVESYVTQIKSILENLNESIRFKKCIWRKKYNNRSYIKDLNLDKKKTLIFSDKPSVWDEDYFNVILTKKFFDKECGKYLPEIKGSAEGDDLIGFLYNYFPFSYYKSKKNYFEQIEWKNQKLIGGRMSPFYKFVNKDDTINNDCFSAEYLESSKYQFTYMKDIIKIIYYFVFYYDIHVEDAIKLIRYNVFYDTYFSMKFYKGEKSILKDIILNCGGQVIEENKQSENNNKIFYICRKDDYSSLKEKIERDIMCNKESKVVTDRYILDSFFFMTNLESEINDPDYSFDNDTNYDY